MPALSTARYVHSSFCGLLKPTSVSSGLATAPALPAKPWHVRPASACTCSSTRSSVAALDVFFWPLHCLTSLVFNTRRAQRPRASFSCTVQPTMLLGAVATCGACLPNSLNFLTRVPSLVACGCLAKNVVITVPYVPGCKSTGL